MKKKILLITGMLCSMYSLVQAQDTVRIDILLLKPKPYKNTIVAELGGPGGIYAFSYERALFTRPPRFQLFGQIGGSVMPGYNGVYPVAYLMVKASYQVYNGHYAELGAGYMMEELVADRLFHEKASLLYSLRTGAVATRLGYRYQKFNRPWSYRAAFTPFYLLEGIESGVSGVKHFVPWGGIGIGYSF